MIPKAVTVNGVTYRVDTRPRASFGKDDDGECRQEKALILVASELAPRQQRSTYLHEVGHAAFFESGATAMLADYTPTPERLEELILQIFLPVYRTALGVK